MTNLRHTFCDKFPLKKKTATLSFSETREARVKWPSLQVAALVAAFLACAATHLVEKA